MSKAVLVVDDSASMRQLVSFTLRQAGFQTVEAVDGMDALERLAAHRVDLILTDLNMPRLDGIGLVRSCSRHGNSPKWINPNICRNRFVVEYR